MPWLAKALWLVLKTRRGRKLLFAASFGALDIARSERARQLYARAREVATDGAPRQTVVGFAQRATRNARTLAGRR